MGKSVETLQHAFHAGINWNACLFIAINLSYTVVSTLFFKHLPSLDYNLWANINSFIYITLLWCDCGFRKAIPQFLPQVDSDVRAWKRFMVFIVGIQVLACTVGVSMLGFILFHLSPHWIFVCYGVMIFLLEAPLVVIQSLYHGNFLNREYNRVIIFLTLLELFILNVLFFLYSTTYLLHVYFISRIVFLVISNIITGLSINSYYQSMKTNVDSTFALGNFIKHSSAMWSTTTLRSLSERNIMVPLLTFTVGPQMANVYKLGNDWALFIQRAIIKSIGTTDITFIAHLNLYHSSHTVNATFHKIMIKIIKMVLPATLIVGVTIAYNLWFGYSLTFLIFLMLVTSYLLEILLAPYQRILEAKKHYLYLFSVHSLYLLIPVYYAVASYYPLRLIPLLLLVILLRALIIGSMAVQARWQYNLSLPWPTKLSFSHIYKIVWPY